MRRRGDAFPGVMEFLIASAVLELKRTVEVISLSGSPLAKDRAGDDPAVRGDTGGAHGRDVAGYAAGESSAAAAGDPARDGDAGDRDAGPEGLAGILDVVGRALEPVYGFRSLATFKSRFKPDYRTLYLYYQDPLQLPAMGRALSRAYLPGLSVRQSARLLRTLVR
jgi:lysylphosphatidylglycerol synthetase-like protein (DUF2156 family)